MRGILYFEMARESPIVSADVPAGTRCPLAITLSKPSDIDVYKRSRKSNDPM